MKIKNTNLFSNSSNSSSAKVFSYSILSFNKSIAFGFEHNVFQLILFGFSFNKSIEFGFADKYSQFILFSNTLYSFTSKVFSYLICSFNKSIAFGFADK